MVGAWPAGACPARSRCEAARAYGDTTLFFANFEFFADVAGAPAAGFVAADGALALGACAQAGTAKNAATITAQAPPRVPTI
jgi:hypothetical protein